jgi:hypothetical protein
MLSSTEEEPQELLKRLLEKKHFLEDSLYSIRFDTSKEEQEAKADLQDLGSKLCQLEQKIIEEIKSDTNNFYNQLKLKDINMENIIEERKKVAPVQATMIRPPSKPEIDFKTSSKRKLSNTTIPKPSKSALSPTASTIREGNTRHHIGLSTLFKALYDIFNGETNPDSDVVALDNEIKNIRVAIANLSKKKTENGTTR